MDVIKKASEEAKKKASQFKQKFAIGGYEPDTYKLSPEPEP